MKETQVNYGNAPKELIQQIADYNGISRIEAMRLELTAQTDAVNPSPLQEIENPSDERILRKVNWL